MMPYCSFLISPRSQKILLTSTKASGIGKSPPLGLHTLSLGRSGFTTCFSPPAKEATCRGDFGYFFGSSPRIWSKLGRNRSPTAQLGTPRPKFNHYPRHHQNEHELHQKNVKQLNEMTRKTKKTSESPFIVTS